MPLAVAGGDAGVRARGQVDDDDRLAVDLLAPDDAERKYALGVVEDLVAFAQLISFFLQPCRALPRRLGSHALDLLAMFGIQPRQFRGIERLAVYRDQPPPGLARWLLTDLEPSAPVRPRPCRASRRRRPRPSSM